MNDQVSSAPSGLPDASATDPSTVTVYSVLGFRSPAGSRVTTAPFAVTAAGTSVPEPSARRVTAEAQSVGGTTGSSKVTVTFVPMATPVAPGAGERAVIVGSVRSGVAVNGSVTDDSVGVTAPVAEVAAARYWR